MSDIRPFRALRPAPECAAQVSAVPYDVVNTEEARRLAEDNPYSFLRVSRPELEMPDGTDTYSDAVYERAAENFKKLIDSAPLITEDEPCLYLYRLEMNGHIQTGVAAACSVDEYDSDLICKHERTRRDKEDDRTRHILTLRAQTGPVFLTYRPDRRIDALAEVETKNAPLYDFTSPDGVRHTIWRVAASAQLAQLFREVEKLYIADGHHRAASASRARAELKSKNANHTGEEDYNRFLAVIFPSDQMQILPYHRVVKDLNGMSPEDFLMYVAERFDISDAAQAQPAQRGDINMYLQNRWRTLRLKPELMPKSDDPTATLDVSLLQTFLLDPLLDIKDVRTDKRIDFVGGIRGTGELERLVNEGKAAVAFALYPTTIEDLITVSDANGIMPPKSTWFEPKLRDGLLIHTI